MDHAEHRSVPQGFLTRTQVAARVGVTVRTLENYWRDGCGPARTRIGKRQLISEENYTAWLLSCTEPQPIPHHRTAA